MKAMRINAPLRLKKLLLNHQLKDRHGDPVPECYVVSGVPLRVTRG